MERSVGLLFAVVLHAVALWGIWQHRLSPMQTETATLFVNFIAPPEPEKTEPPRRPPPPNPKPIEKPRSRQIVAETPLVAPDDRVAPPLPEEAPSEPASELLAGPAIPAPPMPLPPGPLLLSSELSLACPERPAPAYPFQSRRLREAGGVVLRVELGESGNVMQARVDRSSGHSRLDEAALAAVRTWRCKPATRNGRPTRAVALQPFNFILQGS